MPIWGVAVDEEVGAVVLALADKANSRGGVVQLDVKTGETVRRIDVGAPTWDALIDSSGATAYVSSWGEGIVCLDLTNGDVKSIPLGGHLFGLDARSGIAENSGNRELTVTVSGVGVAAIDLTDPTAARLLVQNDSACYKHGFSSGGKHVFVGSSSFQTAYGIRSDSDDVYRSHSVRSILRDSSAVLCLNDVVLLGSLSGEIQVCRLERPAMSVMFADVPGSCWSFRKDHHRRSIWIARGDGFLAEYLVADLERQVGSQLMEDLAFGPASVAGARVFISYAHEDFDKASELYQYLRSVGCSPWMDKADLLGGQDWRFEIERAIRECDFFLLLMSTRSVTKRGFVQKEMRIALEILDEMPESQIYLIPAALEPVEVPPSISRRHWIDLASDEGLVRLCMSIYSGMVSRGEGGAP